MMFNDKPGFRNHTRTELWSWAPRSQTPTLASFAELGLQRAALSRVNGSGRLIMPPLTSGCRSRAPPVPGPGAALQAAGGPDPEGPDLCETGSRRVKPVSEP